MMYQVFQEREQPCDTNIDTAECHVETEGHQFFSTLERSILFPCVKQDHWLNMSRSPSFYVTWEIFFSHFLPHIRAAFWPAPRPMTLPDHFSLPQTYGQLSRLILQTSRSRCWANLWIHVCILISHQLLSIEPKRIIQYPAWMFYVFQECLVMIRL